VNYLASTAFIVPFVLYSWQGITSHSVNRCQSWFAACQRIHTRHECSTQEYVTGPWQSVSDCDWVDNDCNWCVIVTHASLRSFVNVTAWNWRASSGCLARELWGLPHISSRWVFVFFHTL